MTQDDVIRITRSLGICELTSKPKQSIHYSLTINEMLDVFKLVAEHEREACADIAEKQRYAMNINLTSYPAQNGTAVDIANQIRARGQA
jgi:hypothetical protein